MERVEAGVAIWMIAAMLALGVATGCGSDDGPSFSDARIEKSLDLEPAGKAYTVGGDPFCEVSELLNDADEVAEARSSRVLASRGGNAGVVVGAAFAPDCERSSRDALDKLDPKPKEQ